MHFIWTRRPAEEDERCPWQVTLVFATLRIGIRAICDKHSGWSDIRVPSMYSASQLLTNYEQLVRFLSAHTVNVNGPTVVHTT